MRRVIGVLIFCSLASDVGAQTAAEVLDLMANSYAEQISGIDDYTVNGKDFTSRHKKYPGPDGYSIFRSITEDGSLGTTVGNMTNQFGADNLLELRARIFQVAEYAGRADVRGINTHVLRVTAFEDMDLQQSDGLQPPDSVLFFVDPGQWHLLRMSIHGSMPPGERENVTPTIDLEDYRDTEGMMMPYRTRVTMVGLQVTVTQEQLDDARQALELLEGRLAGLSGTQQQILMSRLRPQLDRMQLIVDNGTLEVLFEVESIEVNTGLSDSLFN